MLFVLSKAAHPISAPQLLPAQSAVEVWKGLPAGLGVRKGEMKKRSW